MIRYRILLAFCYVANSAFELIGWVLEYFAERRRRIHDTEWRQAFNRAAKANGNPPPPNALRPLAFTPTELENLMVQQFGKDYRNKVIHGPTGTFYLADVWSEAGLEDPLRPNDFQPGFGLWQMTPGPWPPRRRNEEGGTS